MLFSNLVSLLTFNFSSWSGTDTMSPQTSLQNDGEFASLSPHMSSLVEDVRKQLGVSSIGIATVRKNKNEEWESAIGTFGTANVQGDPVTKDSLFAIASNTKLFTALSVGILIENGTKLPNGEPLKWETKIKDIFKGIQFPDPVQTELVSVLDLASMHSGLPRHDYGFRDVTYQDIIRALPRLRSSAEIRQTYQYCNIGFVMLSGIIPELTGVPFHEFVQQHFFDPLNMTTSYLNAKTASATGKWTDSSMRIGLDKEECKKQWADKRKLDEKCLGAMARFGPWIDTEYINMGGAGGGILSLVDMTKWVKELLDPKVIPADLVKKVGHPFTPTTASPWKEIGAESYGLGQLSFSFRGHAVVTHSGGLPGATSLLLRLVDDNFGIFIATNEGSIPIPVLYGLGYRFLEDHLGLEPIDWVDRFTDKWINHEEKGPETPEHPKPAPAQKDIEGKYEHPVYETLHLQALTPPLKDLHGPTYDDQLFLSEYFSETKGVAYVAPVRMLFATHIIFTHVSGNVFKWTALDLFPTLNKDRSMSKQLGPALDEAKGSAFITSDGIGMFGNFWGAGDGVPVQQAEEDMDNVKERAEVWYSKAR